MKRALTQIEEENENGEESNRKRGLRGYFGDASQVSLVSTQTGTKSVVDFEDPSALLSYLQQNYPKRAFRISKLKRNGKNNVQIRRSREWVRTCPHAQDHVRCQRCGNGASLCEHGRRKEACHEGDCHGSQVCIHDKTYASCPDCGSGFCVHRIWAGRCRECGGQDFCVHDKRRSRCIECGGADMCAVHRKRKCFCPPPCGSGSGLCTFAGCEKIRVKDTFCHVHHPDHVEKCHGVSLLGCRFMDELSAEIGMPIQHSHYEGNVLKRDEFRPPSMRNSPVDGFVFAQNTVIEFLGDEFHGHPMQRERRHRDANLHGKVYADLFDATEEKFERLREAGYVVWYIWESEYLAYRKRGSGSLPDLIRIFDGTLRY